jgi:hypothetical protein
MSGPCCATDGVDGGEIGAGGLIRGVLGGTVTMSCTNECMAQMVINQGSHHDLRLGSTTTPEPAGSAGQMPAVPAHDRARAVSARVVAAPARPRAAATASPYGLPGVRRRDLEILADQAPDHWPAARLAGCPPLPPSPHLRIKMRLPYRARRHRRWAGLGCSRYGSAGLGRCWSRWRLGAPLPPAAACPRLPRPGCWVVLRAGVAGQQEPGIGGLVGRLPVPSVRGGNSNGVQRSYR